MKLEDVIRILGEVTGHKFIVRRVSEPNPTFKVYCKYTLEVYSRQGKACNLFHKEEYTYKVNSANALSDIELDFLKKVMLKCNGTKQILDTNN